MSKHVSVRLPDGVLALVDQRAMERSTSRTEIIEEALVAALGDPLPVERSDGRSISGKRPTARSPQEPAAANAAPRAPKTTSVTVDPVLKDSPLPKIARRHWA